jgi:glyoxylase-like metal-dependent hydrolase (beta-lactamase superfamily II)
MPRRLTEGVWLLDLGLVEPVDSYAYLVDDAGEGGDGTVTLVDAGLFLNRPTLDDELAAAGEGYTLADIDRVLVTHYDLDHVGGLRAFAGSGVPVYVGTDDAALLAGDADPPLLHHKGLFHRVARQLWPFPDVEVVPVGDADTVGGFCAYHTPGHNPGHTVYVHEGLGVAFLGDLVWGEDGALTTPIRLDSYDMDELAASVRDLAARAGEFEVAAMGHGDPLTSGGSRALADLAERV